MVAARSGSTPGHVAAVYWALLDHASQSDDRGNVERFDAETIGAFFGIKTAEVEKIILALKEKKVIIQGRIMAWDRRQPNREDDSRDRVRRYRNARKRNVTHGNAPSRIGNAPEQNRTDKIVNTSDGTDIKTIVKGLVKNVKMNGHGKWTDEERLSFAVERALPFLPGADDAERRAVAAAAEDVKHPLHKKSVYAMLTATKQAKVGWVSPERRAPKG